MTSQVGSHAVAVTSPAKRMVTAAVSSVFGSVATTSTDLCCGCAAAVVFGRRLVFVTSSVRPGDRLGPRRAAEPRGPVGRLPAMLRRGGTTERPVAREGRRAPPLDKIDTALHFDAADAAARRLPTRPGRRMTSFIPLDGATFDIRARTASPRLLMKRASERRGPRGRRRHVARPKPRRGHFRCRTMIDARRPRDDQFPATP